MSIQGSTLSFPIRPDRRGTLQTVAAREDIIRQSIAAIVTTRQGERVMLPDFGIPDFVFDVMDAGFTARLGFYVAQQVKRYEPLVDSLKWKVGVLDESSFAAGFTADQQRAAIEITFTERGLNIPRNLVFPTWRLRGDAQSE